MRTADEKAAFKRRYVETRGYWAAFNDGLLDHSPDWLEAYLGYSSTPALTGPLTARMRELIYVAVDASTTHLFQAGLEIHVGIALAVGCSVDELIEVLRIATLQGLDSVGTGMALLAEELEALGQSVPERAEADAALSRYRAANGEEPGWMALMARLSPEWVTALADLLAVADRTSGLTPAERALIRLALAASPTHLHAAGVREEIRRALACGATAAEIAQVFQLVAHLGLHACSEGIPTILRVAGRE